MNINELIHAVLLNIKENKFRVFLTSLGIIVGTFTIIMVVGIGMASTEAINEQFTDLSAETIMIRGGMNRGQSSTVNLTLEDAEALKELSTVKDIAVSIQGNASLSFGINQITSSVLGVNGSYLDINNKDLIAGVQFSDEDSNKRQKVVILGYTAAEDLFGEDVGASLGEKIKISGRNYEVIGVLEQSGDTSGFNNSDSAAFVPYETAASYIVKSERVDINAQAMDVDSVDVAMSDIEEMLEERKGDISSVVIVDAGQQLEAAKEAQKTMTSLLIGVSVIVLLVGGIGIMNVLLVSVKERTKEIGILKSIGATKKDIMLEFLLESIAISLAGGIIGGLLSLCVYPLMTYTDLQFIPSIQGILLGLTFSIVTGTFFGYYPAKKAAELKPIDALNYE